MGTIKVYGQLQNCTVDGVLANTSEIYDTEQGKFQSSINSSIIDSLPKITENFEGAQNDKGLRYVVRKNKLIAILKDGHVEYAPEGIAFVDAIEPTSFSIGTTTYEVPQGVSYVELGLAAPLKNVDMYMKVLYQNKFIKRFGIYANGSTNTSLGNTFALAADLEWLDLTGLDTKAVTYCYNVFGNSKKLTTIVGKLDFPKAKRTDSMFQQCKALTRVDMHVASATVMQYMFSGCSSLAALDVSGWDTSACTNMNSMFSGCSSLAALDVSGWNTAACTIMSGMFGGCSSLASLDVSGWNTAACTIMSGMFGGCSSLAALDVSGWDTSACTTMEDMFYQCNVAEITGIGNFSFAKCTRFRRGLARCYMLKELVLNSASNPDLVNIDWAFAYSGIDRVDANNFDVSAVTSMQGAFSNLPNLTELDLHTWVTPNLKDFSQFIASSAMLTYCNLDGFILSNVTSAHCAFMDCTALSSLRLSNLGQITGSSGAAPSVDFSACPLDHASLESIFAQDRINDLGYTKPLRVTLSKTSKALLTPEEIAAITAKGYTIA